MSFLAYDFSYKQYITFLLFSPSSFSVKVWKPNVGLKSGRRTCLTANSWLNDNCASGFRRVANTGNQNPSIVSSQIAFSVVPLSGHAVFSEFPFQSFKRSRRKKENRQQRRRKGHSGIVRCLISAEQSRSCLGR